MKTFTPSSFRGARWLPWAGWVLAVGLLGGALGSFLHETDQASLLAGAWKLAHGQAPVIGATFYNYDKQYLAYWLVALGLRMCVGCDPVWVGNAVSFGLFWAALAFFLARRPARTMAQAICLLTCLLAPTLLQHSAFLASNYFSGAFVLLAAGFSVTRGIRGGVASVLCLGLAVAARADALLIIPALLWQQSTRRTVLAFVRNGWVMAGGSAAVAAFLLGRGIAVGDVRDFYSPSFYPKVFLAYVVFGLGPVVLVAAWWSWGMTVAAWRRRNSRYLGFYLLGLLILLPALLYYSVQMFSTRHWTAWLVSLIVLLGSRRSMVLATVPWKGQAILAAGCVATALLPLGVGLHLPAPRAPQFVLASGTRFPTADGNLTMGGYGFALREVGTRAGLVDHNQAVWLAARHADYRPDRAGEVKVVRTPMATYYELALTLRGQLMRWVPAPEEDVYMDSRSWLRRPQINSSDGARRTADGNSRPPAPRPVSPEFAGVRMMRFDSGADFAARDQEEVFLKEVFHGNEFQHLPEAVDWNSRDYEGKTLVWYAPKPFVIELRGAGAGPRLLRAGERAGYYHVMVRGRERLGLQVRGPETVEGTVPQAAASVLMDYMGLDEFAGTRPGG